MKATITRASKGTSEGRSLWAEKPYTKKQTLEAINTNFIRKIYHLGEKFYVTIKLGNVFYTFEGHCNKSRGDFYIGNKEWKRVCNIEFPVGSSLNCDIIKIEDI